MTRKVRQRLEVVHPDCAGIDIGGSKHFVAVDPGSSDEPVRSFGSFTDELERMGRWLHECGVRVVAMESTGVYWVGALMPRSSRNVFRNLAAAE